MRLRRSVGRVAGGLLLMTMAAGWARMASAQADYPFRDTKLATISASPICWDG